MKVYELIDELKDYNKHDEIVVSDGDYVYEIFNLSKQNVSALDEGEDKEMVTITFDEQIGIL